mmetsp:Transcript_1399/g.1793  ORF Transcript_1399/g.1793 Transcript_1399/m.1793 type:complete len:200 (+) Transcript_1399:175-774(+)
MGHEDWVRKLAIQKELNIVASCSSDRSIIIWNSHNGKIIHRMRGHDHVVECVAFSSKEADKAIAGRTEMLSNINPNQEEKDANVNDEAISKSSYGGAHLVSGSRDKTVRIWQVQTGACLMSLSGHDNWVRGVAFQPNGKYILTAAEDKTIRIWDLTKRRCIRTIENAHEHFITYISIHPKLPVVASASVDTYARIWIGV